MSSRFPRIPASGTNGDSSPGIPMCQCLSSQYHLSEGVSSHSPSGQYCSRCLLLLSLHTMARKRSGTAHTESCCGSIWLDGYHEVLMVDNVMIENLI